MNLCSVFLQLGLRRIEKELKNILVPSSDKLFCALPSLLVLINVS